MFRVTHRAARILIIDFTAGDGDGVALHQMDFFRQNLSIPTPRLAVEIGAKHGADVLLCEIDKKRRAMLQTRFPTTKIIGDHRGAVDHVDGYDYVIVINDPDGPSDHGIEWMQAITKIVPRTDFVVAFNEGFITALRRTVGLAWETSRQLYGGLEAREWKNYLGRQCLASTPLIHGSARFRYKILVVADHLCDAAKRRPFEVLQ
jgi:hypothetical protein